MRAEIQYNFKNRIIESEIAFVTTLWVSFSTEISCIRVILVIWMKPVTDRNHQPLNNNTT